ncbi:hypothetical protein ACFQFQ_25795 [Sulfitobacter porphyrae]|uniref:Uncharacterized protein n=1 Tax=Sulfitobacter porphyrae TaxID=1246864 RepID=A0ABW2BAR6_9RHOB
MYNATFDPDKVCEGATNLDCHFYHVFRPVCRIRQNVVFLWRDTLRRALRAGHAGDCSLIGMFRPVQKAARSAACPVGRQVDLESPLPDPCVEMIIG